jgi:hypothetical protein
VAKIKYLGRISDVVQRWGDGKHWEIASGVMEPPSGGEGLAMVVWWLAVLYCDVCRRRRRWEMGVEMASFLNGSRKAAYNEDSSTGSAAVEEGETRHTSDSHFAANSQLHRGSSNLFPFPAVSFTPCIIGALVNRRHSLIWGVKIFSKTNKKVARIWTAERRAGSQRLSCRKCSAASP